MNHVHIAGRNAGGARAYKFVKHYSVLCRLDEVAGSIHLVLTMPLADPNAGTACAGGQP